MGLDLFILQSHSQKGSRLVRVLVYIATTLLVLIVVVLATFPLTLTTQMPGQFEEPTAMSVTENPEFLTSPLASVATATVYFLGDIMLGRHVETLRNLYGEEYPYRNLDFLIATTAPAFVVANFEATVPPRHRKTPDFNFSFSVATTALLALQRAGVTHVSLANNHTFDFGLTGYEHTAFALRLSGILPFGQPQEVSTSSVVVLPLAESRMGILALHTLYGEPDIDVLRTYLSQLNDISDIQVVYVHWGDEYIDVPNARQRELAQFLATQGVDLVIGHHPHVVQSIERILDTLVFYSLGNFIFDQYFDPSVQEGLVLKFEETSSGTMNLHLLPIESRMTKAQPRLMEGDERRAFFADLVTLSAPELQPYILAGEIPVLPVLASSTKNAIMDQ